jgi:hypothetical protein
MSLDGRPIKISSFDDEASLREFYLQVARGVVPGYSVVNKFGENQDIDVASGFQAVCPNGGRIYTGFNATAAETVEVFSSSADDAAAGIGARTITLYGLDANFVEQSETLTLTGTTPVDTPTNTYIRLDRAIVKSAGTNDSNVGDITIRQKTTTANVFCLVEINHNQSMNAAYTIPAGKIGFVVDFHSSITSKSANTNLKARGVARPFGEVFQVKEEWGLHTSGSSWLSRTYVLPSGPFPAKSDMFIQADTDSNNTSVAGGFGIILIEE